MEHILEISRGSETPTPIGTVDAYTRCARIYEAWFSRIRACGGIGQKKIPPFTSSS
jgi:hypothetical protein